MYEVKQYSDIKSILIPFKLEVNKYYLPHMVTRGKNGPTTAHASHKRCLKGVPGAWGYSWTTQPWGYNYGGPELQVRGWATS